MPLLVAVVPPEWHMWGVQPKKFSARFARSIFVPPTLKIVAPPLRLDLLPKNVLLFALKMKHFGAVFKLDLT